VNAFTVYQTITVTNSSNPALTVTQNGNGGGLKIVNPIGSGESLRIEDESPETSPFVVSASGKVGIGTTPDASVGLKVDSTGIKFGDGTIQRTAFSTAANGREVEFQKSATHIQWRYVGDLTWGNLVALDDLRGADGNDGAAGTDGNDGNDGAAGGNGSDGREVQLQKSATHIQWRYVGDLTWTDLFALEDLKGADGAEGAAGASALWNFTGEYNAGLPYAVGDLATYAGETWYRQHSNGGNVGDTPSEGTFWAKIAQKGAAETLDNNQITLGTPDVAEGRLVLRSYLPGEPDRVIFNDEGTLVLDRLAIELQNTGVYGIGLTTEQLTASQRYTLPNASGTLALDGHVHPLPTPADIGAAASSHIHDGDQLTSSAVHAIELQLQSGTRNAVFYPLETTYNDRPFYTAEPDLALWYDETVGSWHISEGEPFISSEKIVASSDPGEYAHLPTYAEWGEANIQRASLNDITNDLRKSYVSVSTLKHYRSAIEQNTIDAEMDAALQNQILQTRQAISDEVLPLLTFVSRTPPSNPPEGARWIDQFDARSYDFIAGAWVETTA